MAAELTVDPRTAEWKVYYIPDSFPYNTISTLGYDPAGREVDRKPFFNGDDAWDRFAWQVRLETGSAPSDRFVRSRSLKIITQFRACAEDLGRRATIPVPPTARSTENYIKMANALDWVLGKDFEFEMTHVLQPDDFIGYDTSDLGISGFALGNMKRRLNGQPLVEGKPLVEVFMEETRRKLSKERKATDKYLATIVPQSLLTVDDIPALGPPDPTVAAQITQQMRELEEAYSRGLQVGRLELAKIRAAESRYPNTVGGATPWVVSSKPTTVVAVPLNPAKPTRRKFDL